MEAFDPNLLKVYINSTEVKKQAKALKSMVFNDHIYKVQDLTSIIQLMDITSLAGDDSFSNITRLCYRAQYPLTQQIISKLNPSEPITCAAVCVYPLRVADCQNHFEHHEPKISIASVVAGFPSGQSPPETTLSDVDYVIKKGATEIDVVINRSLVYNFQWEKLYNEIRAISEICRKQNVVLKVILSCGELYNLQNVYKASMCAMMAGADFIKTSTGKETINAKLVFGIVMIRAIKDFYNATGNRVGLKPAGGIKEIKEALCWITLVKNYMGADWLTPDLFRFGASSLLNHIEKKIFRILFKRYPAHTELSI